jgi:SNF2 family DNA or RNA helicase
MGVANVEELHEGMEPFYVRRLKTEVLDDLPDKYYTTVEVDLLPAQRRAYNEMRDNMLAWIGKQEDQPVAAPVVIAQLTRLQQFACAYGRLETILRKYRKCKYEWCVAPCEGHLVDVLRLEEPSSKLDAAMDIVEDNPGKQIVVFGQSKQMINMFAARLAKRKITTAVYTGDTPDKDRTRLVEEFQQGERQIFAGTIAAGGEGITLTAASTEIYFDRAWNPTANKQSEDRCWRIGQTNAVQVISLIARDTIDFARNAKIELKWSWLKELLGDEMREA